MKYTNYDASFKLALIEEYLTLKNSEDISIRQFSKSKGISHATFYNWLRIYNENTGNMEDEGQNICLSFNEEAVHSPFIRISEINKEENEISSLPVSCELHDRNKKLKLIIQDVSIEFDKEDLLFVLRSIRQ